MNAMQQTAVWRDMAGEARAAAMRLRDPELQRQLLIIAAGYEALACRTEALTLLLAPANCNEKCSPSDNGS